MGRDATTWVALVPARPTISAGLSSPAAARAGIGTPLVDPTGSATAPDAPAPAIAELTIGAGVEPCQTGGTDIAPTNRALPRLAEMEEPQLPSPLIILIAGAVELTVWDAPGAAIFVAPASDVTGAVPWASAIIGGNAVAGYTPIWATDINDETGADVTIDPTWVNAD